jgi:hypothetical protein
MRYRTFGASGLRVSELFLGTMTLGEHAGVGAPPQECRRIVDAYADAGTIPTRPGTTARTCGCLSTPACGGCAPTTSTSTGSTCGTAAPRSKRPCAPSTTRCAGRILYVGISDTPAWLISRANTPGWQLTWAGDDTPPGPPRMPDLYSWAPLVAESMCCTDLVHLGGRSAAIIPGYRGTVSTQEASKFRMSWRTDPP